MTSPTPRKTPRFLRDPDLLEDQVETPPARAPGGKTALERIPLKGARARLANMVDDILEGRAHGFALTRYGKIVAVLGPAAAGILFESDAIIAAARAPSARSRLLG